jgi:hypothetical protein
MQVAPRIFELDHDVRAVGELVMSLHKRERPLVRMNLTGRHIALEIVRDVRYEDAHVASRAVSGVLDIPREDHLTVDHPGRVPRDFKARTLTLDTGSKELVSRLL